LRQLGFADPDGAARNLEGLTPTPRDAELLAPAFPRLLTELAAAPDPDMALNNLERYAGVAERIISYLTVEDIACNPDHLDRWGEIARAVRDTTSA